MSSDSETLLSRMMGDDDELIWRSKLQRSISISNEEMGKWKGGVLFRRRIRGCWYACKLIEEWTDWTE